MDILIHSNAGERAVSDLQIYFVNSQKEANVNKAITSHLPKEVKLLLESNSLFSQFRGEAEQSIPLHSNQSNIVIIGLGDKKSLTVEKVRRAGANLVNKYKMSAKSISVDFSQLIIKSNLDKSSQAFAEGAWLASYTFDKYKAKSPSASLKKITLEVKATAAQIKKATAAVEKTRTVCDAITVCRDFVNEPPNVLNSVTYAKEVQKDAKKLPNVTTKVLGRKELAKENMNLFLSVNAASAHEAQLVHLTYTPKKASKNTKHIALVGKGLTFDTGGYSLKPGANMMNMKFDMAGSATVYAAFRACALLGLNVKVSCFLGMTDNAVSATGTMPDSIVKGRNGTTVEILNTDAEGRLVLADCLTYASELKPDVIVDAATLTGAVLVSLGHETCGLMVNDQKLAPKLLKSAEECDEYLWQLPVREEFFEDLKSNVADLRNIGKVAFGGSAKAAAFLSKFVNEGVSWAHLDIAGIGDSQAHLPYCPSKGASGLMVRTLVHFIENFK